MLLVVMCYEPSIGVTLACRLSADNTRLSTDSRDSNVGAGWCKPRTAITDVHDGRNTATRLTLVDDIMIGKARHDDTIIDTREAHDTVIARVNRCIA